MPETKRLKSRNHGVTESQSFLVRFGRTYVLKKVNICYQFALHFFVHFITVFKIRELDIIRLLLIFADIKLNK